MSKSLLGLGRVDEAIASARSGLAKLPDDAIGLQSLATALLVKGAAGEAMKAVTLLPPDDAYRLTLESAATAATDRAASDRALATLIRTASDYAQYQIAQAHAWRREPDLAFAAITRAWDGLDPGLLDFKTDPLLAPLHPDPRFGEWLRRIGFP